MQVKFVVQSHICKSLYESRAQSPSEMNALEVFCTDTATFQRPSEMNMSGVFCTGKYCDCAEPVGDGIFHEYFVQARTPILQL